MVKIIFKFHILIISRNIENGKYQNLVSDKKTFKNFSSKTAEQNS